MLREEEEDNEWALEDESEWIEEWDDQETLEDWEDEEI